VRRRAALGLLAPAALALAAGCVRLRRTPEARFFVLRATIPPAPLPAEAQRSEAIGLAAVRVPAHLERPQLVTMTGPSELHLDEYRRWAEPLDQGVARTLLENLSALLPGARVLRSPWPASAAPGRRVVVELRRFGPAGDGEVRLAGEVSVLAGGEERVLVRRPVSLRRELAADPRQQPGAAVDAMSELVADLARATVGALREAEGAAATPPACPGS
jgi:uncharacterized lipoprotein YmbA